MRTQQYDTTASKVMAMIAAVGMAGALNAGLIATNEDVPASMDAAGGSETDPSLYVFDNYLKTWAGGMTVGSVNPWVRCDIKNGAQVTAPTLSFVGSGLGSDHAVVSITGSKVLYGAELRVGDRGNFARVDVNAGAELFVLGQWTIGYRSVAGQGNDNRIVVDAGTLVISNKLNIGYNANNVRNGVTVQNGGLFHFAGSGRAVIGRQGSTNDITVVGRPSRLLVDSTSNGMNIPETASVGHACVLTIADEALVRVDNTSSSAVNVQTTGLGGNRVRFATGYLAWKGDHTAHLNVLTQVALWNGTEYVTPNSPDAADALGWTARYYLVEEESEASADTGYAGLGGYTVFTGGKSLTGGAKATLVVIR